MNRDERGCDECTYDKLFGTYLIFSGSDTSENKFIISRDSVGFTSNDISGYQFIYPAIPISGQLDCSAIILKSYEDVLKRTILLKKWIEVWTSC